MLLVSLAVSVLGSMLAGKRVIRSGEGTIATRKGQDF